jgi:hypothetical protein
MKVALRLGAICFICACCHGSAGRAAVIDVLGATFQTDGGVGATASTVGSGDSKSFHSVGPVTSEGLTAHSDGSSALLGLESVGFPTPAITIGTQSVVGLPEVYSSGFSNGAAASGTASLEYYFESLGPTPTVPVLVQASGDLSTSALPGTGGGGETALLILEVGGPGVTINDEIANGFGVSGIGSSPALGNAEVLCGSTGCLGHIREHYVYTFETNQLYTVYMEASATSGGNIFVSSDGTITTFNAGLQYADVGIDPYFSVAPGTPDASAYSFVFSAGIGNAPIATAVPEPSTWAMLLVGFAGLGLTAYRRRAGVTSHRSAFRQWVTAS